MKLFRRIHSPTYRKWNSIKLRRQASNAITQPFESNLLSNCQANAAGNCCLTCPFCYPFRFVTSLSAQWWASELIPFNGETLFGMCHGGGYNSVWLCRRSVEDESLEVSDEKRSNTPKMKTYLLEYTCILCNIMNQTKAVYMRHEKRRKDMYGRLEIHW